MPINRLTEPVKPYQPRYNSTPVRSQYGNLKVVGSPVRVFRGGTWAPAVPVEDRDGNRYYALKCHLDRGMTKDSRMKGAGGRYGIAGMFRSNAMCKAWMKRHREIVSRCTKVGSTNYKNYGAKGIRLYEEWVDPAKFFKYISTLEGWDNPRLQIDRIHNDQGYFPGNVRFVTRLENMHNRSITVKVKVDGEQVPLAAHARQRWPWYPVSYVFLHLRRGKSLSAIDCIARKYKNRKKGVAWS